MRSKPRWVWAVGSVVALQAALLIDRAGAYSTGILLLAIALVLIGVGVLFAERAAIQSNTSWRLIGAMVVTLGVGSMIWTTTLFVAQRTHIRWTTALLGGLTVLVAALMTLGRYRSWMRAALLVSFLGVGSLTIASGGSEAIDVYVFQQFGSEYLLEGANPYSAQYPNIYSAAHAERFYGPGLADEDHLRFGFPYPPMSLFMAVPGYVAAGDYRYGLLASGAVLLWILTRPDNGRLGRLAGALFAVFPLHSGLVGMLGSGWTEPFVALLLALVVVSIAMKSRWLPQLFGIFLASKLTLIVVAPLYFLVDGALFGKKGRAGRTMKILLAGALVTVPLAIWDWNRFWFSVVELQFFQPVRPDALSFTVWLSNTFGPPPPLVFVVAPFLTAAVALFLVFRRPDRSPTGFAFACGFVAIAWLVATKQSFLNHYYFAFAALLIGIAFSGKAESDPTVSVQRIDLEVLSS
jgi:hypothetical protein